MIKVLGIMVLFFVAFLIVRKIQAPRSGTERLAITVWSAFGPYNSAEDAEAGLNRACSAVFGSDGMAEYKEWIQGHVNNFREWQAEQRFQKAQKLMRLGLSLTSYGPAFNRACQTLKMEALEEAQEALNGLSKDFPEMRDLVQPTIDYERQRLGGKDKLYETTEKAEKNILSCTHCDFTINGNEFDGNELFCPECGSRLEEIY